MASSFPNRDRLAARLNELARTLEKPTPSAIERVRQELARIAAG